MKKDNVTTYAFIDASNIIYGAAKHGWRMDFAKLSKYLKNRFEVKRVLYYAGVDHTNIKQLKFYEKLQHFNIELRLVPVKTFSDGRKKADVDARMTFEMMRYFSEFDRAVVLTGDGDYYWVLEYLIEQKKRLWLLSFPKITARELKKLIGSNFANLDNLKEQLREHKK